MIKVKRVLISVSDKKGLLPFAQGLHALGIEIISTGGTARHLKEGGIPVREVSDYTGFPEILDGRVKTLHPKIHGGLLALRDKKEHKEQIEEHHIGLIDMVVVNCYPFASVITKKGISLDEAIEHIDIGGPAMLRSAAKNFKNVAAVSNPSRYQEILKELDTNHGMLADSVLFRLAVEAFQHTAQYDAIISDYLNRSFHQGDLLQMDVDGRRGSESARLPREITLRFSRAQDLRYGENPHQAAAFYKNVEETNGFAKIKCLQGKELSFNNILDLNAAVDFVKEFHRPAAVIIKHNNPTGVAEDQTLSRAYLYAWRCDPVSAFGGIVGLNRKVDLTTAKLILEGGFRECIIAPAFAGPALKILSQKKNLRLIEADFRNFKNNGFDFKKVYGGVLLQEKDQQKLHADDLKVATRKKPTRPQLASLLFGWEVIKHVKSNAILLVKGTRTVGIGCGQTSRVQSVQIAIQKAGTHARNSVLVSDAFLPKTDNIHYAAKAGIKALIQTGGSVADKDVIEEADKAKMAMVMTGIRHFKH